MAGEGLSTAIGSWVDGERILFGKIRIPAGTGAEPHKHPNEQFLIVIEGRARFDVGGDVKEVGKGEIVHIPPNVVHHSQAIGDEDFVFVQAKDASWGTAGVPADAEYPPVE